jgi:hypothetical protein
MNLYSGYFLILATKKTQRMRTKRLTEERLSLLLTEIEEGHTITQACENNGIGRNLCFAWHPKRAEILPIVKAAVEICAGAYRGIPAGKLSGCHVWRVDTFGRRIVKTDTKLDQFTGFGVVRS